MKNKNVLCTILLLCFSTALFAQGSGDFQEVRQDIDWEYYEEKGIDPLASERLVNAEGESILDFIPPMGILLIPESGDERVMAFDPHDGELIDEFFFPSDDVNLTTPIQVLWNFTGTSFLVSDQTMRLVQQFDLDGEFEQTFAPIGGEDSDILNNIRGIHMKPNGNLLVTVAGGGNANSIAMFDTDGEYVGNFIDNDVGGLNGPWSIVRRQGLNDYLVSASGSSGVHRYDADGDFIEMFATGLGFPQQMEELDNGNILVTNFSSPAGVYEYDSEGNQVGYYSVVGSLRGVKELGNNNIMVTNSSGVHIINRDNELIETVISGQARHITHIMPMDMDFFELQLEMDPEDAGAVYGAGSYPEDFTVSITAEPNIYHEFISWTDSDDNVISTQPVFQYDMPAEDVTLTANFDVLDVFDAHFTVLEDSADENPIEDAAISIEGFDPLHTDADGEASISLPQGTYTAHVTLQGYVAEEVDFTIDDADVHIDIHMMDHILAPANLEVQTEGMAAGEALLSWVDPTMVAEFRYDDGIADGQLGFQGDWNSVMGAVHHHNAILDEMTWMLTSEGGPHSTVKVWVLGLDANGLPDRNNVKYTAENVPNNDEEWNTYVFTDPIDAPDGFFIGLSYDGFLGLATDDGVGEPWDFVPGTQFGVFNITDASSDFTPIEDWGFEVSYLLRGIGIDLGEVSYDKQHVVTNDGPAPIYIPLNEPIKAEAPELQQGQEKAFLGFNVYLNDDLVVEEITETEYLFTDLPGGEHTAGVQTAYTTGSSEIVTIDFEIEGEPDMFEVTFHVDITDAVEYGQLYGFDDDLHHIFMTGNMLEWAVPGEPETVLELTSTDPHIYSMTLMLEAGTYQYKYFSDLIGEGWDGGEWPGDPDREVEITDDTVIDDVFETGDLPEFIVAFDVVDADGQAIEDAIITFDGVAYDAGHYVIEEVEPGTYHYIVEKDGYLTVEDEIIVTEDTAVEVVLHEDDVAVGEVSEVVTEIWPNPARSTLFIESNTNFSLVRIVDILGQVIYSAETDAAYYEINVSGFNHGVYFIQLTTQTGTVTKRVQVVR